MIKFHDVKTTDRELIQAYTLCGDRQNCDLSFANIISWRFMYNTQIAEVDGFLVFRFYMGHHLAYMAPVWKCSWNEAMRETFAKVVRQMRDDAITLGHPFLMLGVCANMVGILETTFPDTFDIRPDRDHFDYIYTREKLATLAGKKLQSKRNHCNKFRKMYPDYEYKPLTKEMIPECLAVEAKWRELTKEDTEGAEDLSEELRSMTRIFDMWDETGAMGGTIWVDGKLIAFTFGCPITNSIFDVCVEKADTAYEGSFSIINQEFARHLPEQYEYMNREEDLGLEGLRYAKLSYKPDILLEKNVVMEKYPLAQFEDQQRIREETVSLWRDTFHDPEEFIQLYFSRVFRPEYNVICQVDHHTVAALQTLPYQLKYHDQKVLTAYISGVSVREDYRKQNMGSNLMAQAHFRLYHKDAVFATLIPAEEWLYDWYSRCGYTRHITCTPPPAGIDDMDFATFDLWQQSKPCVLLHDEAGLDIIKEDFRIAQSINPAAKRQDKDIPAMIRVINAEKALQLFATCHPDRTENLRIYNDSDIPMNNIYFHMEKGHVSRTNHPLPGTRSLTIQELADYLFADDSLEMNLMLN
ncbi:MAG: GNAT family N-acetyltransferase [Prevotella sp.]|nr:GNAT family N-acetyltransferase [Prevotella sp.]